MPATESRLGLGAHLGTCPLPSPSQFLQAGGGRGLNTFRWGEEALARAHPTSWGGTRTWTQASQHLSPSFAATLCSPRLAAKQGREEAPWLHQGETDATGNNRIGAVLGTAPGLAP